MAPFRVALTFDAEHPDRPTEADVTGRILDALAAADSPASFFLQGRWVEAYPELAARIARDGHLVGNHSHYHARATVLSAGGVARDARTAEREIVLATGVDPRPWYRLPFGSGEGVGRIHSALETAGYRHIGWDVDSKDWAAQQPGRLASHIVRGALAHGDGAIVLLHGWPAITPAVLPIVVSRLRDAGATFARLDVLPARNWAPARPRVRLQAVSAT